MSNEKAATISWLRNPFADPQAIGKNDNVFGLLPVTTGLKAAAWLMVVHQVSSTRHLHASFSADALCRIAMSPLSKTQNVIALLTQGFSVQFVAFALYLTPLLYMFEKLAGVSLWKGIWKNESMEVPFLIFSETQTAYKRLMEETDPSLLDRCAWEEPMAPIHCEATRRYSSSKPLSKLLLCYLSKGR